MKPRTEVVATTLVAAAVVAGVTALIVSGDRLTGWQFLLSLTAVVAVVRAVAAVRHALSARAQRRSDAGYHGNLAEEWSGSSRLPDHQGSLLRHA
ncbi:MAG: hypothetical protein ACXV3F_03495 [Frankiaceae bacterium]